jgi:hypothetical protein
VLENYLNMLYNSQIFYKRNDNVDLVVAGFSTQEARALIIFAFEVAITQRRTQFNMQLRVPTWIWIPQ